MSQTFQARKTEKNITRHQHDLHCAWGDSCVKYVPEYTHGVFEQLLQDNSNTPLKQHPIRPHWLQTVTQATVRVLCWLNIYIYMHTYIYMYIYNIYIQNIHKPRYCVLAPKFPMSVLCLATPCKDGWLQSQNAKFVPCLLHKPQSSLACSTSNTRPSLAPQASRVLLAGSAGVHTSF